LLIETKFKFAQTSSELDTIKQELKYDDIELEKRNTEVKELQVEMLQLLKEKTALEKALVFEKEANRVLGIT
jgi:hypothetical protein